MSALQQSRATGANAQSFVIFRTKAAMNSAAFTVTATCAFAFASATGRVMPSGVSSMCSDVSYSGKRGFTSSTASTSNKVG